MDDNCTFCKIIKGEIPAIKVYEDDVSVVFKDIEPKARVHLLAVPKKHFARLEEGGVEGWVTLSYIMKRIPEIAEKYGCENGYRLVINQGEDAGQTVPHLHVHILGGDTLMW